MCVFIARVFAVAGLMGVCLSARAATDLPEHLRDTGLYESGSLQVRADNLPFTPQYPLWSDGASKHRWIYLPPGTHIDASNPDAWEFPRGTKLWKEFRYGRAIETRYIERRADGAWRFASYVWNDAGTDAELAPAEGIQHLTSLTAPDGFYAVPARTDCLACHEGGATPVLGFSALQLSPDRDPLSVHAEQPGVDDVNLNKLVARGLIRNLPQQLIDHAPRIEARSAVERAAFGYLHANCGHCHNASGPLGALDMVLAQSAMSSGDGVEQLLHYVLNVGSEFRPQGRTLMRVTPGDQDASVMAIRIRSRNLIEQMPPLGTRLVDDEGVSLITRWINELSTQSFTR